MKTEIKFPLHLRHIKGSEDLSDETYCFRADIHDDSGALIGYVSNDGHGGAHMCHFKGGVDDQVKCIAWAEGTPAALRLSLALHSWGSDRDAVGWEALEAWIDGEIEDAKIRPLQVAYDKKAKELSLPPRGTRILLSMGKDGKREIGIVVGLRPRAKKHPIILRTLDGSKEFYCDLKWLLHPKHQIREEEAPIRLTDCCQAHSTYLDGVLCCKNCFEPVPVGQGDGTEKVQS
jgi:hypothetical protein